MMLQWDSPSTTTDSFQILLKTMLSTQDKYIYVCIYITQNIMKEWYLFDWKFDIGQHMDASDSQEM